ncbi:hypothetical protein ACE6H2_014319 [Prunus campanulata]
MKHRIMKALDLPGTLPVEMARLTYLKEISLVANRLTGPIPKEIGNITTLTSLDISMNKLSGELPRELGNLPLIERMILNSNNFTGELPDTFGNLTTLKDFRVGDSHFSGQIPDFIKNWTNLEKLRITDLSGPETPFENIPLENMKDMKRLILRSCNITGQLPPYLRNFGKDLKTLDLSFNKLIGEIPSSFVALADVDYMNLFESFTDASSSLSTRKTVSCFRTAKCPKTWYSLRINCGGKEVTVLGKTTTTFDGDTDSVGPSSFYQSTTNWVLSSTGYFTDDDRPQDTFIQNNESILSMANPKLILQGRLVEQDFNIVDKAGGVGTKVIMNYTAPVTSGTLEIRFYWAGKGTTGIPLRGVYGPLISAISVDPADFVPHAGSGISVGAVVGIVAGGVFIILLIFGILWRRGLLGQQNTLEDGTYTLCCYFAHLLKEQGNLMDLVDPRLGSDFNKEEMMRTINVALLCCNATSTIRPTMSSVVSMLEGRAAVQILVSDPNASNNEMDAMRKHFESTLGMNTSESQIQTASSQGPLTGSSTSVHDLYPIIPDST